MAVTWVPGSRPGSHATVPTPWRRSISPPPDPPPRPRHEHRQKTTLRPRSTPGLPRREATPTSRPPSRPRSEPRSQTAPPAWPLGSPRRLSPGAAPARTAVPRSIASIALDAHPLLGNRHDHHVAAALLGPAPQRRRRPPSRRPLPGRNGVSIFGGERVPFPKPPQALAARRYNVASWAEHPVGGLLRSCRRARAARPCPARGLPLAALTAIEVVDPPGATRQQSGVRHDDGDTRGAVRAAVWRRAAPRPRRVRSPGRTAG